MSFYPGMDIVISPYVPQGKIMMVEGQFVLPEEVRYKHLTNAYVQWLNLKVVVYMQYEERYVEQAGSLWALDVGGRGRYKEAVMFEARFYIRAEDGLSWDLTK